MLFYRSEDNINLAKSPWRDWTWTSARYRWRPTLGRRISRRTRLPRPKAAMNAYSWVVASGTCVAHQLCEPRVRTDMTKDSGLLKPEAGPCGAARGS